jgi:hypothetical protein
LIDPSVELIDEIPKIVDLEDRSKMHDLGHGLGIFELVSLECSDDIFCQCHETLLFIGFFLDILQPSVCSRIPYVLRFILISQQSETADKLGCIVETCAKLGWFEVKGTRNRRKDVDRNSESRRFFARVSIEFIGVRACRSGGGIRSVLAWFLSITSIDLQTVVV